MFQRLLSANFEAMVFSELHWDSTLLSSIESLITPCNNTESAPKNYYYLYARKTADLLIMNLLYRSTMGKPFFDELENKS